MTERKPPGIPFESWVDRQIREAQQRGEFDRLPGAGRPLPDDRSYEEL
ncbi:molecular chaperone DnaJ [Streptomyces sp. F-3]|nr:molecular chaperone DnaJ [Streptomyces sp. F-3]